MTYICAPIFVTLPTDNGVTVEFSPSLAPVVPIPSGPQGIPGPQGPKGDTGPGVPPGGSAGQYLRKASSTDYDGEWSDLPAPPVTSVNGKTGPVELDAEDVGALPDTTPLFSGDYDDLTNKPTIPTKVSDLTNDSGLVNATQAAAAAPVQSVNGQTGNVQTISLLDVYPIGSIYMSVNSTSPATLFGGTWEQIQDTFLLAAGTNHAAGSTGGEENHVLTVNEMPSHNHNYAQYVGCVGWTGSSNWNVVKTTNNDGYTNTNASGYMSTFNKGGGQAHNNMPPFLAVYVWKRTA